MLLPHIITLSDICRHNNHTFRSLTLYEVKLKIVCLAFFKRDLKTEFNHLYSDYFLVPFDLPRTTGILHCLARTCNSFSYIMQAEIKGRLVTLAIYESTRIYVRYVYALTWVISPVPLWTLPGSIGISGTLLPQLRSLTADKTLTET